MADHVLGLEEVKGKPIDLTQHLDGMTQARFLMAGQVDLGDITGDHGLGVEAYPGQEHLHLLDGGILPLIEDDKGIVQSAAAHIG